MFDDGLTGNISIGLEISTHKLSPYTYLKSNIF